MQNKSAVIVETRNLINLTNIIDTHLKYLDESWHLTIFGSNENKEVLIKHYPDSQFICLDVSILSQYEYSKLLTNIEFWNKIPYESILIFQSDSLLLRKGIEEFLDYDYIGALISIKAYPFPYMNGGLSLRKKSVMIKAIELFPYDDIYKDDYEDIYFVKVLLKLNSNLPTKEVAHKFSIEGVFGFGSLGVHGIDKYLSSEQCQQILNQYKLTTILKITCLGTHFNDFLCATIMEGLKELSHTVSTSYDSAKDSNLILLFSNADYQNRKQFIVENNLLYKTIYIDGSDYKELEDPDALKDFNLIFKRELFINNNPYADNKNILPLPFASEKEYFKFNTLVKDINVSCTMKENTNIKRKDINALVKSLDLPNIISGTVSEGNACSFSSDPNKIEYFKTLARSKISISYPGTGWDCGRFWEILANKCLLFSPKIEIKIPNPFVEFKHYIPYSNEEDLKEKLVYYHVHEEESRLIAEQGFDHLLEYHTTKKRAEYLINEIFNIII